MYESNKILVGKSACFTAVVIASLAMSTADAKDYSDQDGELTVRTVDGTEIEEEDERFASGMMTRVETEELFSRGENLGDALSRVTGVYVRQASSHGQPAYLSVRGGSPRQLIVDLDGLRLSAPAGAGFDFGQMMTEGFGSADVYRGSAASVYGGGAVTGAVRLNPKQAPDEGWEFRGRSMLGSFGTTGLSGAVGVGDDSAGLRVHGGFRQSSGDFDFIDDQEIEHRRVNNDHRRFSIGATADLSGEHHGLRATALLESGDGGSAGPSEFQESFRNARVDDHRGLVALRWDGDALYSSSALIVDAYATAGVQQRAYHYENNSGFMTQDPFESQSTQRTAATTGGLMALVGDSHLARLDIEGRVESYEGEVGVLDVRTLTAIRRTAAISVADEWLLADQKVSLIGAIRAEASHGGEGSGASETRPFLPAAGIIGRLHRQLLVRANIARTFRMADFDELYLDTEGMRGDPDLLPEEAWTTDIGFRLGASGDAVVFRAAYFHNFIDSMILFLPVSAHLFEARNLQNATSRGVEAGAKFRVGDRWDIDGGYTFTQAQLDWDSDDSAPQLPGQPRHRAELRSSIDLTGLSFWSELPEVQLLPAVHYRSVINLDNFGNLQNAPLLRLDMGAAIGLGEQFRAGIQVHNLFDQRHAQDSLHRPLPGRAAYVTLEMRKGGGR